MQSNNSHSTDIPTCQTFRLMPSFQRSVLQLSFCRCRYTNSVRIRKRRKNYVAYIKKIRCAVAIPTCHYAVTAVP